MSAQGSFWSDADLTPAPAVWVRVPGSHGKLGTIHIHAPSGWVIRHCGHPTALWPYYIVTPEGQQIISPNGRAFRLLNLAKEYTEKHAPKLTRRLIS